MSFFTFLEEKITEILFQLFFLALVAFLLIFYGVDTLFVVFILSQIVQNAIKYFDKQENKLTIYSQDNGTNILLVIEDNGCGIKTSDLSRVFEKGFTGSNRNKANATGMGLYLSKKLCDRLGLKLDIASTEKEYTRLTITFPKGIVHNFSE